MKIDSNQLNGWGFFIKRAVHQTSSEMNIIYLNEFHHYRNKRSHFSM